MDTAATGRGRPWAAAIVLAAVAFTSGALLAPGPADYPQLHTILDTGIALMLGVAALLLWDMGQHDGSSFPKWLAIAFGATSVLEVIHVLVAVEWSGSLAAIAALKGFLRPATWPPATHLLPIGVGWALWRIGRGETGGVFGFALIIAVLCVALFAAFQVFPPYMPPGLLGITRPAVIFAPLLWAGVGVAAWRLRALHRLLPPLTWMAATLALANTAMLYSRAPADGPAMAAHLGLAGGVLVLLLSAMQMASRDTRERIRAETALAQLNESLDRQVAERTTDLSAALAQRDLLLREVYHRVKNNLQVVDSLLVLQAGSLSDPVAKRALSSLRGRVYALGLVHQQLMGSANLKTFDVAPFLRELSQHIVDGIATRGVEIDVEAAPLDVGLDFAIPLGLLVTELVTNSLKHAFPGGAGHVRVALTRADDGATMLVVSDDGAGYDSATSGLAAGQLGTTIIGGLVQQLKGTISVQNLNGTRSEVRMAAAA